MDPRSQAARTLVEMHRRKATAAAVWDGPRTGAETTLVLGVLRRRATLDAILGAYSNRRLPLLKPETLATLRTGLYELLFMRSGPAHAVVHAAVENVKSFGRMKDIGFVNALLRNIDRGTTRIAHGEAKDPRRTLLVDGDAFRFTKAVLPDRNHDEAAWLAARASTAPWIARRRLAELGSERALRCLELQAATPATHLRPAPGKKEHVRATLAAEGIAVHDGPHDLLLTLPPTERIGPVLELVGDCVSVQDACASQVAPFAAPAAGARVLDLCAAPGGKATHLAELGAVVTAWDKDPARLERVAENAARLGLANLACGDPEGAYDLVLVDAPCSNTAVLARRPEARWRVKERHLAGMTDRQLRILGDGAAFTAPGGTLVYSTCSLEPEENAGVVDRFVARGGFRLDEARTLYPDEAAGDGGFMARLQRV